MGATERDVPQGFIEFAEDGAGQFGFIAVRGWMDCRSTTREGRDCVEFSWEGDDEGDQISGRGWATLANPTRSAYGPSVPKAEAITRMMSGLIWRRES